MTVFNPADHRGRYLCPVREITQFQVTFQPQSLKRLTNFVLSASFLFHYVCRRS